jgi:hypothetical protein
MRHYLLLSFVISIATLTVSCKSPVQETTEIVRQSLARIAKDPDSIKVRNLVLYKDGTICGEVNGKNSYGAYTGYQNFTGKWDSQTKTFTVKRVGALEPHEQILLELGEKQGKSAKQILPHHFCGGEIEWRAD